MKQIDLGTLPIIPEQYDSEHLAKIDFNVLHSEMTETERKFINGLIRFYRPKNVIEAGVSYGAGTVNLLNAIFDIPEATLTSIDRLDYWHMDKSVPVGSAVSKVFPDLPVGKWNMLSGKDPSQVLDSLDTLYDFAVIDTAHLHPIESLNFLCLLPYLQDGAIVILHDISLYAYSPNGKIRHLAARILSSSVVGNKLFPQIKSTHYISEEEPLNNIVAIQITDETRKYIKNVFMSLFIPWETLPFSQDVITIQNCIEKHYEAQMLLDFKDAVIQNFAWVLSEGHTFSLAELRYKLRALPNDTVFYGAGGNMMNILNSYEVIEEPFDYEIWDINAEKIKQVKGYTVKNPEFATWTNSNRTLVITIDNKSIADAVADEARSFGWRVIVGRSNIWEIVSPSHVITTPPPR